MATNPGFTRTGVASEQNLYENLIIEALKIYGHDFLYLNREVLERDDIFGEDISARFDDSIEIEMYVETVAGYDGEELFQKFGLEIQEESVFIVSKKRWEEETSNTSRPKERDLIYVPFSKSFFEITKVEHEKPFYQLMHLPVYRLNVTAFQYNDEEITIDLRDDVDISNIVDANAMTLTLDSPGAFEIGEDLIQTQSDGTITGIIQSINGTVLEVSNVESDTDDYNVFEAGLPVTSTNTQLTRSVDSVGDTNDNYEENDDIEDKMSDILGD